MEGVMVKLLNRATQETAELRGSVERLYLKRSRNEETDDGDAVTRSQLENRIQELEDKEREAAWKRRQLTAAATAAQTERDASSQLLEEARRRQEMDREFLSGLQKALADVRAERDALKAELDDERKRVKQAATEEARELARLRRLTDTQHAEKERLIREHADDIMRMQQEGQAAVDAERARTERHDAANRKSTERLRRAHAAAEGRLQGVEMMYSRVVHDRLAAARTTFEQARQEIVAGLPALPPDITARMDTVSRFLDSTCAIPAASVRREAAATSHPVVDYEEPVVEEHQMPDSPVYHQRSSMEWD